MNTALALTEATIREAAERARLRGLAQECRNVAALFAGDGDHDTAAACLMKARRLQADADAVGGEG